MPAPRPPEFRRRAAELARRRNKPTAQTARDLGIAESCRPSEMARQGTDQIRRSAGDCGRIPCGASERYGPHASMTLSLSVSCSWRQSQRGGRGSRAPVSEPAQPGEPGPAVADLSGQPDAAHGASETSPGKQALTLVEPQQA